MAGNPITNVHACVCERGERERGRAGERGGGRDKGEGHS